MEGGILCRRMKDREWIEMGGGGGWIAAVVEGSLIMDDQLIPHDTCSRAGTS